jgi:hypothetical protein
MNTQGHIPDVLHKEVIHEVTLKTIKPNQMHIHNSIPTLGLVVFQENLDFPGSYMWYYLYR